MDDRIGDAQRAQAIEAAYREREQLEHVHDRSLFSIAHSSMAKNKRFRTKRQQAELELRSACLLMDVALTQLKAEPNATNRALIVEELERFLERVKPS